MKCLVSSVGYGYIGDKNVQFKFDIYESGPRRFLEIQIDHKEIFTVELCPDEKKVKADTFFSSVEEVELLAKMTEMVKDAGLWKPKFSPGDLVLVDKPSSKTVKVIDPMTQTSETIEKKQVIIEKDECSCSMRTLMTIGCRKKLFGDCE